MDFEAVSLISAVRDCGVTGMNSDISALAQDVLALSKNSILVNLRFMDKAFSKLDFKEDASVSWATDGRVIRYSPSAVLRAYAAQPGVVARDYLHLVFHCIFQHLFIGEPVRPVYWDLACDIVAEHHINELGLAATQAMRVQDQHTIIAQLSQKLPFLSAEKVYRLFLEEGLSEEEAHAMRQHFLADDHRSWYDFSAGAAAPASADEVAPQDAAGRETKAFAQAENSTETDQLPEDRATRYKSSRGMDASEITKKEKPENAKVATGQRFANSISLDRSREQWKNAAYEMGVELETFTKLWGTEGSALTMGLKAVNREKQDYREFLRKFATRGEEIKVNDNDFDYIFYCYGLQMFKRMPLIEPLEYVDEKRIRDFVIAIDTSASTKDELVHKFMTKTYNILQETESFFQKMNLYIIQCDAAIADVAHITSRRAFDDYLAHMQIKGLGGTDFRPVFAYVDALIEAKELTNLGGLIYFTDGQGTYPAAKPDYDTAFIFVDDTLAMPSVPSWAIKLEMETEDIGSFDEP
ncbi:MAG: VWA-like domain-containing protein [Raoultibacter sp.]